MRQDFYCEDPQKPSPVVNRGFKAEESIYIFSKEMIVAATWRKY